MRFQAAATAAVLLSGLVLVGTGLAGGSAAGAGIDECGQPPAVRSVVLGFGLEPGTEAVTAATRAGTIAVICDRLGALHVGHTLVAAAPGDRLLITAPAAPEVRRRVVTIATAPGNLHFYDWEPNLIGRERAIAGHPGFQPPQGALRRAETEWLAAGRAPRKPENRRLIFSGAFPTFAAAKLAAGRRGTETVVVSEVPAFADGSVDTATPPGWFALHDAPALSGADITDPAAELGEFGEPIVTFGFTEEGRRAFERVTRKIARRGRRQVGHVRGSIAAEALSGHLALVLDDEVKTRPIINFVENPNGIDGRTGAQISGGFESKAEAQDLAAVLRFGALPLQLSPAR